MPTKLVSQEQARDKQKDPLEQANNLRICNYSVLPDLGNLKQAFFDKTDTLTSGTMRVAEITTHQKCYLIPSKNIELMITECMANPDNFSYDDDLNKIAETDDYSEKSQEYDGELEGLFDKQVCEEVSGLDQLVDPGLYPDYLQLNQGKASPKLPGHPSPSNKGIQFNEIILRLQDANLSGTGRDSGSNKDLPKEPLSKEFLHLKALEKKFLLEQRAGVPTTDRASKKFEFEKGKFGTDSMNGTSGSEDLLDFTQDFRIEFKVDRKLTDKNFVYDIHSKKEHLTEVLNLLMVCAECGSSDIKTVRSMSLEDRAILDLLFKLSYQIQSSSDASPKTGAKKKAMSIDHFTTYEVTSRSQSRASFDVVCVNAYSMNRGRMSVIMRDNASEDEYCLVVRGEDSCFRDCFNPNLMGNKETIHYKALLTDYRVQGLKRIILAVRKLTRKEVIEYLEVYNMISESSREQLDTFELHADKIEKRLNFVGCIGVKDIVREDAHRLVRDLGRAKIQVNILSGDIIDNCLNVAKELGLTQANFSDTSTYFSLNFRSEKQGLQDMRRILDSIYELLMDLNLHQIEELLERVEKDAAAKPKNIKDAFVSAREILENSAEKFNLKRTLLISGHSTLIVSSSQILRDYLKTILLFSNCVIGFGMQPSQKAMIVLLSKELDQTVLAVGDGFNDICMFNQADVSVQIFNKDVPMIISDIQVVDLNVLRYLILFLGSKMNSNLMLMQILVISVNIIGNTFQSLYLANSLFATPFITGFQTLSTYAAIAIAVCFFMLTDFPYTSRFTLRFPALYFEREILHGQLTKILVYSFVSSIVQGFLIYFVATSVLAATFEASGRVVSKGLLSIWASYVFLATSMLKVFYMVCKLSSKALLVYAGLLVGFCLELLLEFSNVQRSYLDWLRISHFFGNVVYIFALFCIGGIITYVDWFLISLLKHRYVYPVSARIHKETQKKKSIEFFREPAVDLNIYSIVQEHVTSAFRLDVIGAIKKCFDRKTINDSYVQRIMSIDYFNFSLPIDRLNQIKDISERRKFTRAKQSNEDFYLRLYLSVTLAFGLLDLLRHVLLSDFRHMYYLDCAGSYLLLVYSFGLLMTFAGLKVKLAARLFNRLNTAFVALNLLFSAFSSRLFYHSTFPHAARMITAPVCSDYLASTLLAIANEAVFPLMYPRLNRLFATDTNPFVAFHNNYFAFRMIAGGLVYLIFKIQIKSRVVSADQYDRMIKLDFVTQERLKTEIGLSNEKLVLLMPKFVLDRINYLEMSSRPS